jgi:hypothetical protein
MGVLDPTDEGELEIEPFGNYASSLLYCNIFQPTSLFHEKSSLITIRKLAYPRMTSSLKFLTAFIFR